MVSITDHGTADDPLDGPPLYAWAGAVAAALDGSDETVNTRIAAAIADGRSRVTHPNGDDVLVEAWDEGKGRWQRIHYDSGWRNVSSLLVNGWTATGIRLRRINGSVHLNYYALSGAAATSDEFITGGMPAGFRPTSTWMRRYIVDVSGSSTQFGLMQVNALTGAASCTRNVTAGRAELDWTTDDPIPTSLPGTLISSAPA